MILDFHLTDDVNMVGYYAGYVASSFSLAQFCSSFFWGKMSDRVGRKPILMLGSIGSIISVLCIGLSWNLPLLITARVINGTLNGNIGVVKTYIGEITDRTNQVEAFGWIGLTWGLGSILGPVIGGMLIKPTESMPWLFGTSGLFKEFPYLLPNLVIAMSTTAGCLFIFFYMKETLKKEQPIEMETTLITISANAEDPTTSSSSPVDTQRSSNGYTKMTDEDEDDDKVVQIITLDGSINKESKEDSTSGTTSYNNIILDTPEIEEEEKNKVTNSNYNPNVFKNKLIIASTCLYAISGLIYTMYDEAFPLWAIAKVSEGGLGFNSHKVGIVGALGGVSVIVMQILIVKPVTSRLGIIRTFKFGCIVTAVVFATIPLCTYLASSEEMSRPRQVLFWSVFVLLVFVRNLSGQLVFTPVMTLINNSATSRSKGAANGLGQSLVALCRTIAPTVAATSMAWSLTPGHPFPINHFFVFILMSLIAIAPAIYSDFLPRSLNSPIVENEEDSLLHTAMMGVE
eukprot:gene7418-8677_t